MYCSSSEAGCCETQLTQTTASDCGSLLTGVCNGNECIAINPHPTLRCTRDNARGTTGG